MPRFTSNIQNFHTPFEYAVAFTLDWEVGNAPNGGYTTDPNDPGGATKWGISQRAYPQEDIANLTLERAMELYFKDYWSALGLDNYPLCFAVVAFDTAVNCGVSRTRRWIEEISDKTDWLALLDKRRMYYYKLRDRNPQLGNRFIRGWLNRLNDLRKYIDLLAELDKKERGQ